MLKELASKTPPDVCVGVGTVMDDTVCCLKEIKELGNRLHQFWGEMNRN